MIYCLDWFNFCPHRCFLLPFFLYRLLSYSFCYELLPEGKSFPVWVKLILVPYLFKAELGPAWCNWFLLSALEEGRMIVEVLLREGWWSFALMAELFRVPFKSKIFLSLGVALLLLPPPPFVPILLLFVALRLSFRLIASVVALMFSKV